MLVLIGNIFRVVKVAHEGTKYWEYFFNIFLSWLKKNIFLFVRLVVIHSLTHSSSYSFDNTFIYSQTHSFILFQKTLQFRCDVALSQMWLNEKWSAFFECWQKHCGSNNKKATSLQEVFSQGKKLLLRKKNAPPS